MIHAYREIWLLDFEFHSADGDPPIPICMVAREWCGGRVLRLWREELLALREAPFALTSDVLFVSYYSSAELGCFLALGWPMPANVLDLFVEFKLTTSGLPVPCGRGLLGALAYYGLGALDAIEKDAMRDLAMRGGIYTDQEKLALLDYCQSDVESLAKLLPIMIPKIDLSRALLRGRYMAAVARIERTGVPIDVQILHSLRTQWDRIKDQLITAVDADFGVYEGRSFKRDLWANYLHQNSIPWPHHESGTLDLSESTFREMSRTCPTIAPMHELRHALSQLRLNDLAVGRDGRNRCLLSPFSSKTGRNQPSNSRHIFGPAVWLRGLIRPEKGMAIAYIDYEQQEFGIGAALAGDARMQHAYLSGDPYLAFAVQAGAVPHDATKDSHKAEREQFKISALAVQYGMGEGALGQKLNVTMARSRDLLRLHRETYPDYWRWSDAIETTALLTGRLNSSFGWAIHVGQDANPRSLRNFPLQANGAEMLRLACIFATERGIKLCAPIHDALLIEAEQDNIERAVRECQQAMRDASEIVLAGFVLRTEAKIFRFPDRYGDPRGNTMWKTVMSIVASADSSSQAQNTHAESSTETLHN